MRDAVNGVSEGRRLARCHLSLVRRPACVTAIGGGVDEVESSELDIGADITPGSALSECRPQMWNVF